MVRQKKPPCIWERREFSRVAGSSERGGAGIPLTGSGSRSRVVDYRGIRAEADRVDAEAESDVILYRCGHLADSEVGTVDGGRCLDGDVLHLTRATFPLDQFHREFHGPGHAAQREVAIHHRGFRHRRTLLP